MDDRVSLAPLHPFLHLIFALTLRSWLDGHYYSRLAKEGLSLRRRHPEERFLVNGPNDAFQSNWCESIWDELIVVFFLCPFMSAQVYL